MSQIVVKYQVTDEKGEILHAHSTYSQSSFTTVEQAQEWIDEQGEWFTEACYIDSKNLGFNGLADDLLIVRVDGFPITREEVLA